jgi:hypothetical protein
MTFSIVFDEIMGKYNQSQLLKILNHLLTKEIHHQILCRTEFRVFDLLEIFLIFGKSSPFDLLLVLFDLKIILI